MSYGISTFTQRLAWQHDVCQNGHPFDEENTYVVARTGARRCRACQKARRAAEYAANREESLAASAAYRAAHLDEIRARAAAYRAANREKVKALRAAWIAANPEKRKAIMDNWRAKNREEVRDYDHRKRAGSDSPADTDTVEYLAIIATDPCAYCGGPADCDDHIVPHSSAGGHHWTNLTRACKSCNSRKWTSSLLHWMLRHVEAGT